MMWLRVTTGMVIGLILVSIIVSRTNLAALLYLPWFAGLGVMVMEMIVRNAAVLKTVSTWLYVIVFWVSVVAGVVLLLSTGLHA
jgi:hypothetical protein